ncbi:AAA family ATPase [Methylobacterium sp. 22177]|uniref:AAA family ATPase n=1 Tax=Methylobacterium sp. 22177 TaxID=3453885 RepID=UPI003F8295A4
MTTSDDYQRLARRAARQAAFKDSEEHYRRDIVYASNGFPTLGQLFAGAMPADGTVTEDARRWTSDLLRSPTGQQLSDALKDALELLGSEACPRYAEEVEALALQEGATFNPNIAVEDMCGEIADRATLYGAMLGDPQAAGRAVALLSDTLQSYAHVAQSDPVAVREIVVTMLQCVALCQRDVVPPINLELVPSWQLTRSTARRVLEMIASVAAPPEELLRAAGPLEDKYADARVIPDPNDGPALGFADARHPTRVVLPQALESKKPTGAAKPLIGKGLPLHPMPDLAALGERLVARRPWLVPQISRIMGTLAGRETAAVPNMLFVGPPGTGKTELACDLAEGLRLPNMVYGCAGIADSSIQGTSKQWSSARYSVFTQLLVDNESADGVIVLDELDKSGATGGHNGSLREAIVAVGELSARRRFFDLGLDGQVDISGVSLIATANDVSQLRGALLDRFMVVEIPGPRRQDLPVVARGVMDKMRQEMADGRWLGDLDEAEINSLASWRGGSIRPLRRAIEHLVALRSNRRFAH